MKFNRLTKILIGMTLVIALTLSTVAMDTRPAYAEENVEGGAVGEEGADGETMEGEEPAEGEDAADALVASGDVVTPGTIIANNGLYIANSFPDSYLPSGFRKQTVAYQGQNIDLAYMDASNGLVSLAYLTDATGSFGDFYLCDTATATMSDYVRFEGGNDRFIIVLSNTNVSAPDGFAPTALSVNGKSVSAWVFTGESSGSDDEKSGGFLSGILGSVKPVKAYAGELDLGVGAGAGDGGAVDVSTDVGTAGDTSGVDAGSYDTGASDTQTYDGTSLDTTAADTAAVDAASGASSDYFLLYAIDQSGNQGFYYYDSVGQTYMRYAEFGAAESDELAAAKKSARIRLFIIAGLAVLLLVLLIILINMALSGKKGDDYYDDDDDYEEMKRRVEKKSKRSTLRSRKDDYDDYDDDDEYDDDYDDDDEYEDEEDVKVYSRSKQASRRVEPEEEPAPKRKAPAQDIDLDDDFSFDFIKR